MTTDDNPNQTQETSMTKKNPLILATLSMAAVAGISQAAPQKFAHSYEAKTLNKGQFEFENNVTWGHDSGADGFEFEHELEFGVSDKFQLSLLAEWEHERVEGEGNESAFIKAGVEGIYQLTNPASDPLGSALLGEVAIGDEEFSIEGKLLISKDAGPFTAVYNVGLEGVWAGQGYDDEKEGEFSQTAGVSYAISSQLSVGAELQHAMVFPEWDTTEVNSLHLGPNVSLHAGGFWAVLSAGWEVTDEEDAPDFVGKVRFGFVW